MALSLVVAAATAYADSSPAPYISYTPWPQSQGDLHLSLRTYSEFTVQGEHPSVALAAEEVVIVLHEGYADVSAVFDFVNDGPACDVAMCFPLTPAEVRWRGTDEEERAAAAAGRKEIPNQVFGQPSWHVRPEDVDVKADFRVTVGGRDTPVTYEINAHENEEAYDFGGFAKWPVPFDAGARRRVICNYVTTYAGFDFNITGVEYAVFTGAPWKGPIGRGRIVVKPGAGFDWTAPVGYLTRGMPPGRDDGDALTWEFENLEPVTTTPADRPAANVPSRFEDNGYSSVLVLFPVYENNAADVYVYPPLPRPAVPGAPAVVSVKSLNLRTGPGEDNERVATRPPLQQGEGLAVQERRGEWYRVVAFAKGGAASGQTSAGPDDVVDGWVRWRCVDPETGEEDVYVDLVGGR
jgi:hypothetical protein